MIKILTEPIRSLTKCCVETLRGLLIKHVSLSNLLNQNLEVVFGLVKGVILPVGVNTQQLSQGASSIRREFAYVLGCPKVLTHLWSFLMIVQWNRKEN